MALEPGSKIGPYTITAPLPRINIVLNWFEELKGLVPVN